MVMSLTPVKKGEKYVSPVATYYAAVRLAIHRTVQL